MLKSYSFLLVPEAQPDGCCRVTCTQANLDVSGANEGEATAMAINQLEAVVKAYVGWEKRRTSLPRSTRKTSFGAHEVVFEVDLD